MGRKGMRARRPPKQVQLIFETDALGEVIGQRRREKNDAVFCGGGFKVVLKTVLISFTMNKNVKIGLIGVLAFICILVVIFLINARFSHPVSVNTACLKLDGESTCHSEESEPYRYYGTKTAYHIAFSNDTEFQYGDCEPQMFYLFSRHATRYPDKKDIEKMIVQLPILKEKIITLCSEGKCSICDNGIKKLKSWNMSLVPEYDNHITESGREEAIDLAQRFRRRYPMLLDRSYSSDAFVFEYTSRERSQTTAEAFAKGLFGKSRAEIIDLTGKANDKVLQFHKECKKLQSRCNSTSYDLSELGKFKEGPFLKSMRQSISKRLGFEVDDDEINTMYRACVFGFALKDDDIWCSVFSTSDMKVLEFDADIDDYYKDGYGNKLSYEQACPAVRYIVNLFKNASENRNLKAVLHFSHAGAIKKVIARFGLFQDEIPPMANSICTHPNRSWRSSLICPFNANIAFVLFQCGREHKIAAFHNEKPVLIGGCSHMLCPIEQFYSTYDPIAANCNIQSMCCTCCTDS